MLPRPWKRAKTFLLVPSNVVAVDLCNVGVGFPELSAAAWVRVWLFLLLTAASLQSKDR